MSFSSFISYFFLPLLLPFILCPPSLTSSWLSSACSFSPFLLHPCPCLSFYPPFHFLPRFCSCFPLVLFIPISLLLHLCLPLAPVPSSPMPLNLPSLWSNFAEVINLLTWSTGVTGQLFVACCHGFSLDRSDKTFIFLHIEYIICAAVSQPPKCNAEEDSLCCFILCVCYLHHTF